MPLAGLPERGTMLIAALLILALLFAGSWIYTYVQPGANPWALMPWFGIAALVILVIALVAYLFGTSSNRGA